MKAILISNSTARTNEQDAHLTRQQHKHLLGEQASDMYQKVFSLRADNCSDLILTRMREAWLVAAL